MLTDEIGFMNSSRLNLRRGMPSRGMPMSRSIRIIGDFPFMWHLTAPTAGRGSNCSSLMRIICRGAVWLAVRLTGFQPQGQLWGYLIRNTTGKLDLPGGCGGWSTVFACRFDTGGPLPGDLMSITPYPTAIPRLSTAVGKRGRDEIF